MLQHFRGMEQAMEVAPIILHALLRNRGVTDVKEAAILYSEIKAVLRERVDAETPTTTAPTT